MTTNKKKTVKKTKNSTKTKITRDSVIAAYMSYILENGERPKSIYKFTTDNGMEERDFYTFFGSFEGLREEIWVSFHQNTIKVLDRDKGYESYPNKEKMLAYFYTFFELLTANRSYVLFTLSETENNLKNLKQLRKLRHEIKDYASDLIEQGNEDKNFRLAKNPVTIFSEGAWLQTLFLLKYWKDDNSANFEQTDVAIEKSVKAIFDVFETAPLESVFDFGKFLFKNHFASARH